MTEILTTDIRDTVLDNLPSEVLDGVAEVMADGMARPTVAEYAWMISAVLTEPIGRPMSRRLDDLVRYHGFNDC